MAKKQKEEKSAWKDRYEQFQDADVQVKEDKRPVSVLDKKAAANIVGNGAGIRNITIIKRMEWLLIVDVWFVFGLCCLVSRQQTYERSRELLMIDVIATGWALFEIIKRAIDIYKDYSLNIPEAVRLFGSKAYAENCYKAGLTEELIYLADKKQQEDKIAELKKRLQSDILKKMLVPLVILLVGSFCLWGYIRYWETGKALLFGLLGIPAAAGTALLITLLEGRA